MKSRLTIRIQKRSQTGWLCWLIIMMPFFFGTLNDLLGLPWAIRYILDAAWMILLLMQCLKPRGTQRDIQHLSLCILLFFVYALLSYLPQYQSGFYFLWGVRNNFRFYVAFFAFCAFLKQQDADRYLDIFNTFFWINVLVSLVQFFLLDIDGDYLGGLFGTETGSNGYTNMFFCIVLARSVTFYLGKRETIWKCFSKFVGALVIAAIAELKFFFMEAILIIVLAVLFTNFSWRKVWILIGGLAGIFLGASLLVAFFPNSMGFLSLEYFWSMATTNRGYTSSGDLNRLTAIPMINELWLDNFANRIFGLGLGNCDTSSFAIVNTPFYEQNGDMHYSWLSYAMMYLECGWIGLVFYYGFFALVYLRARKIEKTCSADQKIYCTIARIMAIVCMIIAVYNSSLRTEAAYMAYFVMAIPFAVHKNERTTASFQKG